MKFLDRHLRRFYLWRKIRGIPHASIFLDDRWL